MLLHPLKELLPLHRQPFVENVFNGICGECAITLWNEA
jgi:hypothetical protein